MQSTTQIPPSNPPKDPIIAVILSLLFGGGGQLYLGQQKKGIILIVAMVLTWCVGLGWVVELVGAYDAYVLANKLKSGKSVGDMEFFWQANA
jgi:TM2 domain-containing membrane protein YozV